MTKTFKFALADGRSISLKQNSLDNALTHLRELYGSTIADESVIGLDIAKPKFWLKRGNTFYPISASAAAVCTHR